MGRRRTSCASARLNSSQVSITSHGLISDITANATGELFLYVNDAVLTLPGLTDVFYKNNSGKAKVTVTRIMAEEIVPPPTAAGVQARLRDDSAKPGGRPGDD